MTCPNSAPARGIHWCRASGVRKSVRWAVASPSCPCHRRGAGHAGGRDWTGANDQATLPPSTRISRPVISELSSDTRKSTVAVTSSGRRSRPKGEVARRLLKEGAGVGRREAREPRGLRRAGEHRVDPDAAWREAGCPCSGEGRDRGLRRPVQGRTTVRCRTLPWTRSPRRQTFVQER